MNRFFLLCAVSVPAAAGIVAAGIGYSPSLTFSDALSDTRSLAASVFFVDSVTAEGLRGKYRDATRGSGKVRILIVPGHDDESPGTQFNGVREVEMTARVGEELFAFLSSDPQYEPVLVRTRNGYTEEFAGYFAKHRDEVRAFVANKRQVMADLNKAGMTHQVDGGVVHNNALPSVAARLYSINKWANDNKADIVLHLHFNDYPGRPANREGRFNGFALYIPERQFSNSRASKAVAESLFSQFSKFYAESNLPNEDAGIVPDQDLIAIGAYNTLDPVGILIEYGYIYEPRFQDTAVREIFLKELAFQTYLGINRFFGKFEELFRPYQTSLLPFRWNEPLAVGARHNPSVLSMQAALLFEEVYPPGGDKRRCPLSGSFGPCTERAVRAFQEKYGIMPATGVAGALTLAKLNEKYSR